MCDDVNLRDAVDVIWLQYHVLCKVYRMCDVFQIQIRIEIDWKWFEMYVFTRLLFFMSLVLNTEA